MASFEELITMYSSGQQSFLDVVHYWGDASPNSSAVLAVDGELCYADLAVKVGTMAHNLDAAGVGVGDLVGVSVERTLDLLPLLLAVWSLGAAYVPLDPTYPLRRRQYIIKDSGVKLVVCDSDAEPLSDVTILPIKKLSFGNSTRYEPVQQSSDALAYLIYTSGSTGAPKGVMVTTSNVANFLISMKSSPGMTSTDRLLATTTISFDIHVLELFLPLLVGAQVVIAAADEARSLVDLQRLIDDCYISIMQATPATWRLILVGRWRPALPLKILVGGEAFPRDLLGEMLDCGDQVWNMYGPTETTVWSTCYRIPSENALPGIGFPIRGTSIYIVDENNHLVKAGNEGELLIGGAGVTWGYKGMSDLTSERFISLPELSADLLYRTGDLVNTDDSGCLHYINRLDNQIKIRGFRIEPGDVERALSLFAGVNHAVVVSSLFSVGDERLMAFYVGVEADPMTLRRHCAGLLPPHMVPQHFICVSELPKTDNQKIDRKALKENGEKYVDSQFPTVSRVNGEPRDDRDRSVVAVWEGALGVFSIGIDDDFFDLGGHSLLVFPVVEAINRATGLSYTPADLFERPTIRAVLSTVNGHQGAASVVKLNTGDLGCTPIFCLCGVNIYFELATQFKGNPVYGMFAKQEIALIDAASNDCTIQVSISHLVEVYVDAILRQEPYREVILVGLSFGGILSIEVAKALESRGVKVVGTVLLDAYLPGCAERTLIKTLADTCLRVRKKGVRGASMAAYRRFRRWVGHVNALPANTVNLEMNESARERMFDQISCGYSAQATQFRGHVLLVKAKNTDFGLGYKASGDYGWGELIEGRLSIENVDADHVGMMKGDAIGFVYEHISKYLKREC